MVKCRDAAPTDLTPTEEERVRGIADMYIKVFAPVNTAYRNAEMTEAYFEVFRSEFQRIVETYPALKSRMLPTLQHFDMKLSPLFGPAFD